MRRSLSLAAGSTVMTLLLATSLLATAFADSPLPLGTFVATGEMQQGRAFHGAVRLQDGRVLVIGGVDGANTQDQHLDSVELYDPATGSFSLLQASMSTPRAFPSAVVLNDGQVLITGGSNGNTFLNSGELFNPNAGDSASAFTPTEGPMTAARSLGIGVLLESGEVLIVGGNSPSGALASTEIYNPEAKTFRAGSGMATRRDNPTATRLLDGRVLVTGGWTGRDFTQTAELYEPHGLFTPAGEMATRRGSHAAVLLRDGRVLVAGGEMVPGLGNLASAELYDPSTNSWSLAASMAVPRANFTATLLPDGRVLVTGGMSHGAIVSSAEIYDPTFNGWSPVPLMQRTRQWHTATPLSTGDVLIAGGIELTGGPHSALHSAELYLVPPIAVTIDIKPGSSPNSVNLGSHGAVSVAILSTSTFNATTVNPTAVTLEGASVRLKGNGTPLASFQDINGDGLLDFLVQVSTDALQLSETDTEAVLEGQTFDGMSIRGVDSVRVVP